MDSEKMMKFGDLISFERENIFFYQLMIEPETVKEIMEFDKGIALKKMEGDFFEVYVPKEVNQEFLAAFVPVVSDITPLMDLIDEYKELVRQEKRLKEVKAKFKEIAFNGGGFKLNGVSVSIKKESVRNGWDTKKLEVLAETNLELAGCRKVSIVKPSIVVKVSK